LALNTNPSVPNSARKKPAEKKFNLNWALANKLKKEELVEQVSMSGIFKMDLKTINIELAVILVQGNPISDIFFGVYPDFFFCLCHLLWVCNLITILCHLECGTKYCKSVTRHRLISL
jgi:hypothetical protein